MKPTTISAITFAFALGLGPALAQDIVSPKNGATIGPEATRFVVVAPAGAKTTILSMDGVELARFRGPGQHVLTRRIQQPGRRSLLARSFNPSGGLKGSARATVTVRSLELVPPTARGRIRSYPGKLGVVRMNARTAAMLANARQWLETNGGCPPTRASSRNVTQGSYSRGVDASAGTHDGGGALDLSVAGLSSSQRERLVRALREAGFAAWLRRRPTFKADHIHALAIGDPDLASSARSQVRAYFNGRDGLVGNRRDAHGGPIVKSWMRSRGLAGLGS
jgi:hypothetical protein